MMADKLWIADYSQTVANLNQEKIKHNEYTVKKSALQALLAKKKDDYTRLNTARNDHQNNYYQYFSLVEKKRIKLVHNLDNMLVTGSFEEAAYRIIKYRVILPLLREKIQEHTRNIQIMCDYEHDLLGEIQNINFELVKLDRDFYSIADCYTNISTFASDIMQPCNTNTYVSVVGDDILDNITNFIPLFDIANIDEFY
jgi:hypothetical protein